MKFLFDENLPLFFCEAVRTAGFEVRHVCEVGLEATPDEKIIHFAARSGEVIVTNDLDFSRIMSLSGAQKPSILTFRLPALSYSILHEIAL